MAHAVLVYGHILLEEGAHALDVLRCGELLRGGRGRRLERHLECAQSVDFHAVGLLQVVAHHLHHLGEDGEGVGLLCGGVVLDALSNLVEGHGVQSLGTGVPFALVRRGVSDVLVKFVKYCYND